MFVGHFAVAFAAKGAVPRAPLPLLVLAAQLADTLWPVLVALGIEQVRIAPGNTAFTPLDFVAYPYSHSLALLVVWGIVLGVVSRRLVRHAAAVAIVAALVVSHWVLDWLTHRPDLPLYPGSRLYGLGLWNSIAWTLAVELTMFGAGAWVYTRATRPRDSIGRWAWAALIGVLLAVYIGNLFTTPPSISAIYIAALAGSIVIVAWAWWLDRHRRPA